MCDYNIPYLTIWIVVFKNILLTIIIIYKLNKILNFNPSCISKQNKYFNSYFILN